jgi:hypothetical protein
MATIIITVFSRNKTLNVEFYFILLESTRGLLPSSPRGERGGFRIPLSSLGEGGGARFSFQISQKFSDEMVRSLAGGGAGGGG